MMEQHNFAAHLNDLPENENYLIYILPKRLRDIEKTDHTIANQFRQNSFFLIIEEEDFEKVPENLCGIDCLDFTESKNYYFSFFEILKKLLPGEPLEAIIGEFKRQGEFINEDSKDTSEKEDDTITIPTHPFRKIHFLKRKQLHIVSLVTIIIFTLGIGGWVLTRVPVEPVSIRSNFALPSESTLLNRSELIAQIDNKFKAQRGGIQTIAIVGIGGAGKTTLARFYAHQQKTNVIWEINAETHTSLTESFAKLAQALALTEEAQKIVRGLLDITDPKEREEQILYFVRERLKSHKKWLLIYDNVENFSDIQKYFPQDSNIWGMGKVILTTRNSNIHNSNQIHLIIQIGELNQDQKFNLFMQSINPGEKKNFTVDQREDTLAFLKQIPPFPLDVSVAAYYLKTVHISYAKYLESLNQCDKNFITVQENLQKEAGNYTKTRYSIITLSLSKLLESHKDFGDLFLFMSLLDSQNIPRALLDHYKNHLVVDNFIYHLKKYSLITSEASSPSLGSALSIHRSTQAIALTYLTKTLDLEQNKKLLLSLGSALENYIAGVLEKEKLEDAALLSNHCEKFLSHKDLLTEFTEGSIESKWGEICYFLYNYDKAMELLENSLPKLQKYNNKNPSVVAWTLAQLGNIYRIAGKFEDARRALEQSLVIYKQYSLKDSPDAAFTLAHLGNIYRELGSYEKAESLYTQSLLIYKKCFSENHIRVAWNLIHLGYIYNILGDYKKSQDFFEQGLLIYKQHFPEDHVKIGWSLLRLSKLYLDIGYFGKAQKLCKKSLQIYKNQCEDSIDVADVLTCLGNIYSNMGKNIEAKQILERSLKIAKKHFSKNHIKVSWILVQLGNVYKELANYKEAKGMLENTLLNYERYYGKNHINTAHILESLGQIYFLENNLQLAENFLNTALFICQKNKHPHEYKCLEDFSDLHLKKSDEASRKGDKESEKSFRAQAITDLTKALEILKTHFPEDSAHRIRIQGKIKGLNKDR
ncbi:MAG: tetratricopeptide repeat protein [Alphaproteobacteria bacterium]|nr:tetratricopeptide repeat protein [Alphaproteobacteria bacterium]